MRTAPNWSNSVTPPGQMEGHSSKTTNSCEASSSFEVDNINKEAILWDFLQKCKDECRADGLVDMHFAIFFHPISLKYCPGHEKVRPGHTKCCTCQAKLLGKPEDLMLQDATPLRNLPTSLIKMSLVLRLPREMHLCRASNVPRPASFLQLLQNPRLSHFWQRAESIAPATQNDAWTCKSGPTVVCFAHFDFEMCFAPEWSALFEHLNFQKCSGLRRF